MKSAAAALLLLATTVVSHDFCSHIAKNPPKHCSCSNDEEGFTFGCSANLLHKDVIELSLQVLPCAEPVTAVLKLNDTKFHLHHELAGLTANDKAIHVPFPGLSLNLGHFGSAGVMCVVDCLVFFFLFLLLFFFFFFDLFSLFHSFLFLHICTCRIDFDLTTPGDNADKHLDIDLGFDACATVKIFGKHKTVCGSKIDKHLPYEVLQKSYDFTSVCGNTTKN